MFIGIYLHMMGKQKMKLYLPVITFASAFEKTFGSLRCFELRPTGFQKTIRHICVKI